MPAVRTSQGFYGWVNLTVAAIIGIIAGFFYLISFGLFLPILVEEFGWNLGVASLAATINMIALGLCGPFAGKFIVKYGARRSVILGNCMGFAGFLLLYFHSHLWQLFIGYGLLAGTGAGFGGMLAATTVVNTWFVRKRAIALGIFLASGGVGGMVMGPAIARLIETIGWRSTFLIISLLVLIFAVVLPALLIRNKPEDLGQIPDGPRDKEEQSRKKPVPPKAAYKTPVDFSLKEATRTRELWFLIAYFCLNMLAIGALMTHQVAYLRDIGITYMMAAFALSVMSGVMAFSQLSVGFIGMRYSMHMIAVIAEVLKLMGIIIILFVTTLPFVFVYMVVLGLGFGAVMAATMNMIPNYFGMKFYPKIMGFMRLFWTFVGGAGAPLAGFIRENTGSYIPAFQGAIVMVIMGLVFLILARPPLHPSLKEAKTTE